MWADFSNPHVGEQVSPYLIYVLRQDKVPPRAMAHGVAAVDSLRTAFRSSGHGYNGAHGQWIPVPR